MTVAYRQYTDDLNSAAAQEYQYPTARFSGRGVVICAGGDRYFTNAWVCANILRLHGCNLPIEFWHLGPGEMTDEMRALVQPLGVICVDAYEMRKRFPARTLNGWELKPYAIINSSFDEVLFLDADNVAVKNPEYLFDTAQYKETGAIFWPDYDFQRLKANNSIWNITQIEYRDEPAFESGQIVIDKRRSWKALQLTMHLNEWSDFYYKHIHGDKDTFHLAWHKLQQKYSMPAHQIVGLAGTMCQHDFDGNRIFQHRNLRKWTTAAENARVDGFWLEPECLQFVEQLRTKWSVTPKTQLSAAAKTVLEQIEKQRHYLYTRVGYDARPIALLPGGYVAAGDAAAEHGWAIIGTADSPRVGIFSGDSLLVDLTAGGQGMLHGRWTQFEKMPCVLLPISATSSELVSTIFWSAQYGEDIWLANNCAIPNTGFFVEVGGGYGIRHSNTYWLEQKGWRGLVVEADERNLSAIQQFRNVTLEHCAAASFDGETAFTQCADSTLSGVLRNNTIPRYSDTRVTARRLDTLLQQRGLPAPDLISIDTEGSELDVLIGLGDIRPQYLVVEYGVINGATIEATNTAGSEAAISARLLEMGYVVIHRTISNIIARYKA
jgi:FkbM family methyltransferase